MRLDKLIQSTNYEREPNFSVLTDEELEFYDETLSRVGFDWDTEGDLSLLTDEELAEIQRLNDKAKKAGTYAN